MLGQRLDRRDLVRSRLSVGPGHGGDDAFEYSGRHALHPAPLFVRPGLAAQVTSSHGTLSGVTRRLFLVAGSAGSGKSTLAKALARELDAGWLQLDSIWLAMKVAAGEGTPARDILDIDRRMCREDEADDEVLAAHVAASGDVCRRCRRCWGSSSRLTSGWWPTGRGCCRRS